MMETLVLVDVLMFASFNGLMVLLMVFAFVFLQET